MKMDTNSFSWVVLKEIIWIFIIFIGANISKYEKKHFCTPWYQWLFYYYIFARQFSTRSNTFVQSAVFPFANNPTNHWYKTFSPRTNTSISRVLQTKNLTNHIYEYLIKTIKTSLFNSPMECFKINFHYRVNLVAQRLKSTK